MNVKSRFQILRVFFLNFFETFRSGLVHPKHIINSVKFQYLSKQFLNSPFLQTYRVLQTIQMKLLLLCVWAEPAVLGSAKTALKIKYEL